MKTKVITVDTVISKLGHKERGKFVSVKKRDAVINFILDIVEQFCLQISTAFVAIEYVIHIPDYY